MSYQQLCFNNVFLIKLLVCTNIFNYIRFGTYKLTTYVVVLLLTSSLHFTYNSGSNLYVGITKTVEIFWRTLCGVLTFSIDTGTMYIYIYMCVLYCRLKLFMLCAFWQCLYAFQLIEVLFRAECYTFYQEGPPGMTLMK